MNCKEMIPKTLYARTIKLIFNISQIYMYLFVATSLISSISFYLNMAIGIWCLPLSSIVAILFFKYINEYPLGLGFVVTCCLAGSIFCVFCFLSGQIFDTSADGNYYHKLAIGLLKNGWNPLFQRAGEILNTFLTADAKWPLVYVECYPKASWFFATSIYELTENIECGKVYTIISIFCAFGITLYYFLNLGINKIFSILFSTVAACNPITFQQFDTYYVDGYLQIMCYILVISIIMSFVTMPRLQMRITNAIIFCSIIICFNIKFTGALFSCFYSFVFFLIYSYREYLINKNQWLRLSLQRAIFLSSSVIIAIILVGSSTYITNYVRYGNIGHPIIGKNSIDIITSSSPFPMHNRISNLFNSIYSYPDNFAWNVSHKKTQLKIPFTYSHSIESPFAQNRQPDIRIAGFGPFFSGLLTLGLCGIGVKFLFMPRNLVSLILITVTITSFLLCIIIKESWWARYSPYIYFICLAGIYAFYTFPHVKSRICHMFASLMCVVLLINNCYFLWSLPAMIRSSQIISNEINRMKGADYIRSRFILFGPYFNLVDARIKFINDMSIEQANDQPLDKYWRMIWRKDIRSE